MGAAALRELDSRVALEFEERGANTVLLGASTAGIWFRALSRSFSAYLAKSSPLRYWGGDAASTDWIDWTAHIPIRRVTQSVARVRFFGGKPEVMRVPRSLLFQSEESAVGGKQWGSELRMIQYLSIFSDEMRKGDGFRKGNSVVGWGKGISRSGGAPPDKRSQERERG